jgi:hypothetical protein
MLLDQAAQFANLEPAFISETVTRQLVASISDGPQLMADLTEFLNMGTDPTKISNFFHAGKIVGKMGKIFLDFTINN